MRLARLATIELNRPAPSRLGRWTLQASNGVEVTVSMIQGAEDATGIAAREQGELRIIWPYERTSARLAVQTIVRAGAVTVDDESFVEMPEEPRSIAEAAIGEYADLLAVTYQCRRIVRSPKPCVALIAESPEEQAVLDSAAGIRAPFTPRPRAILLPEMSPGSQLGQAVADRLDGAALLADALSEDGPVGQVHNLFRVFERGFASGPGGCIDPLHAFLEAGTPNLGWSADELGDWFLRLRPEVTHADRRDAYARAADVQPYLGRIEYAAYDVLLNKALWRNRDSSRRQVVTLAAGIDADKQTLRLQRPDVTVVAPWIDPFGVFPIDFNFQVQIGKPALTEMPGYATEHDDRFTARATFINDFAADDRRFEAEVLTEQERGPGTNRGTASDRSTRTPRVGAIPARKRPGKRRKRKR